MNAIIKNLTEEQKVKFLLYTKKWTEIGLSTKPFSQEEAEEIVWAFQAEILEKKKTPVLIFDNPVEAWGEFMKHGITRDQVIDLAIDQVWSQVHDNVEGPLREQVWIQVDHQVSDQIWYGINDQIWQQVWHPVGKQIEEQLTGQIEGFVWPYQHGSFSSHNFGFYDYLLSEGIVKISKELQTKFDIWAATAKLGLIYPLWDFCVVTQKPSKIEFTPDGGLKVQYKGWDDGSV